MARVVASVTLSGWLILGAAATSLLAQAPTPRPAAPLPAKAQAPKQGPAATGADLFLQGWNYDQGLGTPIRIPEAIRLYNQAAAQGSALAKARLSQIYFYGSGVVKDPAKAEQLAEDAFPGVLQAAQAHDPIAESTVGTLYADGLGTARSITKAIEWLTKAAADGVGQAASNLGVIYENGEGVPSDIPAALAWYRRAVSLDNPVAEAYLGDFYHAGRYVPCADVPAERLWRRSAEQGFAHGQTNLGWLYAHGCVVAYNPVEAARLYRLAAEQNFAVAETNLGTLYEDGRGVPCDIQTAVMWYRRAAAQGNRHAIERLRCLGYGF